MDIKKHPAYLYAVGVITGKIKAPIYVIKQCYQFKQVADGKSEKYFINMESAELIGDFLELLIMPKGFSAGKTVAECAAGFQWFFYIAVLCTVHRDDPNKRRYETAVLEIGRKNGKTFIIAVIILTLLFLEPTFSKFFSVAPDGSLSRLLKEKMNELIISSPALNEKLTTRRDDIFCKSTQSDYVPLNYSTSRLDGKEPNVYLIDETGALPCVYAIEAMQSGQLTVENPLGFIVSTKYPTAINPFEDQVTKSKRVLDGTLEDDTWFSLLYEPDDKANWATNDEILMHVNPLALVVPKIMAGLFKKRTDAIEMESKRENFITKHCNIVYQGVETETYIAVSDVQKCKVEKIDWTGKEVYLGLDMALTTDNVSWSMVGVGDNGKVIAESIAFVPEGRIEEKNKLEHIDYRRFIKAGKCFSCGDRTIDYGYVEKSVMAIQEKYGVKVIMIGFDRYNCLSTAQKLEASGYQAVEVNQMSSVLHSATKLLEETIIDGNLEYEKNDLLEINFGNARCSYSANMNRYVNKKKSAGKVDMCVSLIIAVYLLQENVFLGTEAFGVQVG